MEKINKEPQSPLLQKEGIEQIPNVEALAIIGHCIEKDATRGWVPTRLIQKMNEGKKRSGIRDRFLGPDEDSAYVGGGAAVALAAAEMYNVLVERGMRPKAVTVVQGRPLYLESAPPNINEGVVMLEAFKRKTTQNPDNIITLGVARNTAGELEEHLKMCVERGYASIGFVLLDVRMERAQAFLDKLKTEHPEFQALQTHLVSAEALLRERYKDNPRRLEQLERVLKDFSDSQAYAKMVADEHGGAEAVRDGTYKGTGDL